MTTSAGFRGTQVREDERGAAIVHHQHRLVVVAGPDKGLERSVDRPCVAIGAARENDVVLTDPTVSRRHCEIGHRDGRYYLRDLGLVELAAKLEQPVGLADVAELMAKWFAEERDRGAELANDAASDVWPSTDARSTAEIRAPSKRSTPKSWLAIGALALLSFGALSGYLFARDPEPRPVASIATAPVETTPIRSSTRAEAPAISTADPAPPKKKTRITRKKSEPGTVDISTPGGWAFVVIDGKRRGQTPVRLTLPAGKQVVILEPFGNRAAARSVNVQVVPNAVTPIAIRVDR